MEFAMSQEERGIDEEATAQPSSTELSPAESAESADPVAAASDQNTAVEEASASAPIETDTGANTVDSPAGGSAEAITDTQEEATSEAAPVANDSDAPNPEQVTSKDKAGEEASRFKRGEIHHGIISSTKPTAVTVDLGDGDEGIVPGRELELMTRKMLESLVVGAEVDVYIVNPRNHRGETVLSINHALEEIDWRNAEDYVKSKAVYEALIGGYNKGGLIVRFGRLRGFVPQSQLAEERARSMSGATPEERYGPMVNKPIGVKVMEVDRHRNRLILSERAALREVRQARKEALIADLKVGDVRKGVVVSLENFGAFVDIGGGEGLVHLSELAWGHITHPRQAVSIGDEIEVEVININPEAKRIGLSRRRVISDPWDEVATALQQGQLVRGRVTKLTKFGAFARLIDNDAVEGLIHISELSGERVTHPREVVNRGDELVLRIVKIDIKERRLGLSLKSVNSTEYLDLDWDMAIQESTSLQADPGAAEVESPNAQADAEQPAAQVDADETDAQAEAED
jgi:small subunit ribosomal protein S1